MTGADQAGGFRSGRWGGYYVQGGRRAAMSLTLSFESGAVGGGGIDRVGEFYIHGSYTPGGAVEFIKQYVGRHQVRYTGTATGSGIAGSWAILRVFRGRFHIWPLTGDVAEVSGDADVDITVGANR